MDIINKSKKYKILLLGDSTVGKSSIALRLLNNTFNDNKQSTVGVAYCNIFLGRYNNIYICDLWDTAGQERFNSLISMYCRDANVALLVYDVTDLKTIDKLTKYLIDVMVKSEKCGIIVLGNKADYIKTEEELIKIDNMVKSLFNDVRFEDYDIDYLFVSAKNGEGIDELKELILDYIAYIPISVEEDKIIEIVENEKKKDLCCT